MGLHDARARQPAGQAAGGLIRAEYLGLQIAEAEKAQVISKAEANSLGNYHEKVAALLDVDDFAPDEFLHRPAQEVTPDPAPAKPAKKKPAKKKPAKKTASRKKTSKKKASKA
jgi:hypothetical protein